MRSLSTDIPARSFIAEGTHSSVLSRNVVPLLAPDREAHTVNSSLQGLILIFGMPRSGTTWLGKIIDSHPDVIYRHEPDIDLRTDKFGYYLEPSEFDHYSAAMKEYVEELTHMRSVKVAASLPLFKNRGVGPLTESIRTIVIHGARLLGRVGLKPTVPDFIELSNARVAIKSVSAMGRAGLMAQATGAKVVIIARHPCAQINSMLRGVASDKLPAEPLRWPLECATAAAYGLNAETWPQLSIVESLAWKWVISHEMILRDCPSAMIVRHEDLCMKPHEVAEAIFDYLGLEMNPQTRRFLDTSTTAKSTSFFSVARNSQAEVHKWRKQLNAETISEILQIVHGTPTDTLYA